MNTNNTAIASSSVFAEKWHPLHEDFLFFSANPLEYLFDKVHMKSM